MGNTGFVVPWSFCFIVRVRVGGGIAPGDAVGGGCLDSRGVGGW